MFAGYDELMEATVLRDISRIKGLLEVYSFKCHFANMLTLKISLVMYNTEIAALLTEGLEWDITRLTKGDCKATTKEDKSSCCSSISSSNEVNINLNPDIKAKAVTDEAELILDDLYKEKDWRKWLIGKFNKNKG